MPDTRLAMLEGLYSRSSTFLPVSLQPLVFLWLDRITYGWFRELEMGFSVTCVILGGLTLSEINGGLPLTAGIIIISVSPSILFVKCIPAHVRARRSARLSSASSGTTSSTYTRNTRGWCSWSSCSCCTAWVARRGTRYRRRSLLRTQGAMLVLRRSRQDSDVFSNGDS